MKKVILIMQSIVLFYVFFAAPLFAEKDHDDKDSKKVKFVPAISLILDVSGVYRSLENEEYKSLGIPGFFHGHGHDDEHAHTGMHGNRGFNLNYGELKLSGEVDKYFELVATFHLQTDSFEIEKAYFETKFLPFGFTLKVGKFLSNFGILSGLDAHDWDFADQALVYSVFFGDHGINELGAQLIWKAPIHMPLKIGFEVLKGDNEMSFGTGEIAGNNDTITIEGIDEPNIYTIFAKSSIKIDHLELIYGVSFAYGQSRMNNGLDEDPGDEERHAVEAKTWFLGGDLTIKYHLGKGKYVSLQNEYIYRHIKGDEHELDSNNTISSESLKKKQSGFYSQLIVKPHEHWRFGARFDWLHLNRVEIDGTDTDKPENLIKLSAMSEFSPTHFSRIRLQYSYDRSKYIEEKQKDNHEVILQFTMIIGAHGEHDGHDEDDDDHKDEKK